MEPSQRVSLKGVNRTQDMGEFILVRPLAMKVKAYVQLWWNCCGLEDQGAESLYLDLELLFLVLEPPPGCAFIYTGRRPLAYRVPMPVYGDSLVMIMRSSLKQHVGLLPDDVSWGPKLSKPLSCVASLNSAQPLSS